MSVVNEFAKEYYLEGNSDIGIVLTHGFTSSPSYMRPAAEDLNKMGYHVFAPLLYGHGIDENYLKTGDVRRWAKSVGDGIRLLRNKGVKKVFCMGHSLGGVMSMIMAENGHCDGLISVAAPVRISEYRRVVLFSIFCRKKFHTMNTPDGKEKMYRYYRADGKSISSLLKAMRKAESNLKKITVPTMVIVSTEDATVKPISGKLIYDGISSEKKEYIEITGTHGQCIWESRNQYMDKIHKFIEENT